MQGTGSARLRPGARLGKYRVEREIGRGAMGVVYLALQENLNRHVALKVCPGSADRLERFRREALAVARLNHPHIVQVYDVERADDLHFVVFEYLPGGNLRDQLRRRGPLPVARVLRVIDEVASALEAAHRRGIIHRDVKPSNILFDEDGRAKLADFGIALLEEAEPAAAGDEPPAFAGTVLYAAPEQLTGGPVDRRTDLYSLAVVLLELLLGEPVFPGETPEEVAQAVLSGRRLRLRDRAPEWPEMEARTRSAFLAEAESFFNRALARTREERFADARQFRQGLRRVAQTAAVNLPELPPPADETQVPLEPPSAGPCKPRGLMATTTVGLSLLVLEHVPWRGGLWDRLRELARARVAEAAEAFEDSVLRRRLSVALARLKVGRLERELAEVEARAHRLQGYGERERRRAEVWRERASRAVARIDEAGARLAALREAEAREAAHRYDHEAQEQETRAGELRQALQAARDELLEAQRLWDLAVSRRDRARLERPVRGARRRALRWAVRVLAAGVVIWLLWQLVRPEPLSEEVPSPAGDFIPVGPMAQAREDHTATVLPDGRVLVVGGQDAGGRAVAVTEIYDPAAGRFTPGPALLVPRFNHTATLLGDGSVLVVGGEVEPRRADAVGSAERVVPGRASVAAGSLGRPRCRHAAVALPDGSVLVVGGQDARGRALTSVERYRPGEGRFEEGPPLRVARRDAAAAVLADGSVLVLGGDDAEGKPLDSVELLRPGAPEWEEVGRLREPRYEPTVTVLADGKVLVVGGGRSPRYRLRSIELFDPESGRSEVVARLRFGRRVHSATVVTLDDEEVVLVVGGARGPGAATSEVIVPPRPAGVRTWRVVAGPRLGTPRMNHVGVVVARGPDGAGAGLLVVGGYDPTSGRRVRSAEFLPWSRVRSAFASTGATGEK